MTVQTVQYATNVRYIHADRAADGRSEHNPCVDLWLGVIHLAIEDARRKNSEECVKAREWIFERAHEADFRAVCDMAHLDFVWVRAMARKFINLPQLPLARVLNGAA